jgi:uncharacterized membrane protein YkoI
VGTAVGAQQGALPGQQEEAADEPGITGTVPAPGEGAEDSENETTVENEAAEENEATEENEAAEAGRYEGLAKIDKAAAEKAALDAVPGEVRQTELEDSDGFVVYEVEVAGNDGKSYGVVVDAGNGRVLARETGEDED